VKQGICLNLVDGEDSLKTGPGRSADGDISSALNQNGVEFLITDLDLACTFLDFAQASWIEETVSRNHNNARKAYETVQHLLKRLTPDAGQRQAIEAKLALLKTRLQAVGQQF
jgi:hypothetical protein